MSEFAYSAAWKPILVRVWRDSVEAPLACHRMNLHGFAYRGRGGEEPPRKFGRMWLGHSAVRLWPGKLDPEKLASTKYSVSLFLELGSCRWERGGVVRVRPNGRGPNYLRVGDKRRGFVGSSR